MLAVLLGYGVREGVQDRVHHFGDAAPLRCGNRKHALKAKTVKVAECNILIDAIDFVYDQVCELTLLAQIFDDLHIGGIQPSASVHQQQNRIGLFDRQQGLRCHREIDALLTPFQPAGIDNDVRFAAQPSLAILAIPRQTGKVGNQRIAAACEPIEQRRFAHIGAPYQSQDGFHKNSR